MGGRILHVRLLGGFGVELDGEPVAADGWRSRRRAAALTKLLALAPDHRLTRDAAMGALWPDADARAAGAGLRKAAYHARRLTGVDDFVVLDRRTVALLPGAIVTTDAAAFEAAARAALEAGTVSGSQGSAADACARYGGELLPEDRGDAWRDVAAAQLARLHRDLLVASAQWGRLLAVEPTSEVAHRAIMEDRLEAGDRSGAIRQFEQLRQVLREELGVSPDPTSIALYERILAAPDGREAPTPAERARALLAWGVIHWERADLAEAERAALEARALAIDAGLGRELADASELRGLVAYAQGRWQEVFTRELVETFEHRPELAPFIYDANLCMSEFALHEPRGLARTAAFADALLTSARRSGSVQARALGLLLQGEVELLGGGEDPDAVAATLRRSRTLHEVAAARAGSAIATAREAQLHARSGATDVADQLHELALELAIGSPVESHLLPLVFGGMLSDASPTTGVAILARAEAALDGVRRCEPCSMSFHLGAAAVHRRTGALDAARGHLAEAERVSAMWQGGPWRAAVDEARAELRAAEGAEPDEVTRLLAAAAVGFERTGRRTDATRCREILAARGAADGRANGGTLGERCPP